MHAGTFGLEIFELSGRSINSLSFIGVWECSHVDHKTSGLYVTHGESKMKKKGRGEGYCLFHLKFIVMRRGVILTFNMSIDPLLDKSINCCIPVLDSVDVCWFSWSWIKPPLPKISVYLCMEKVQIVIFMDVLYVLNKQQTACPSVW